MCTFFPSLRTTRTYSQDSHLSQNDSIPRVSGSLFPSAYHRPQTLPVTDHIGTSLTALAELHVLGQDGSHSMPAGLWPTSPTISCMSTTWPTPFSLIAPSRLLAYASTASKRPILMTFRSTQNRVGSPPRLRGGIVRPLPNDMLAQRRDVQRHAIRGEALGDRWQSFLSIA